MEKNNKRNIRDKRYEYYRKSKELEEIFMKCDNKEKAYKIKEQQDRAYKMFKFYDNMIKSLEKNKKDK